MPDRAFVAKRFPCTVAAVVVDPGVNSKYVCAKKTNIRKNKNARQQLDQLVNKVPVFFDDVLYT